MNFNPLDFLIGALAVWRISAMIAYERGPLKIFHSLRSAADIFHFDDGTPDQDLATKEIQRLMLCVWCSGFWIALIWILGYSFFPMPTMIVSSVLALSAGAIVIEKINNG